MRNTISVRVDGADQAGEARRRSVSAAASLGFSDMEASRVGLVATECATNLVKHAGGGEILIQPVEQGAVAVLELLALDKGPGISNLDRCLGDGYSTAGSPGTGLGAIRRLSSYLEIYTLPGKGVALLSRFWRGKARPAPTRIEAGAVCVPKRGEEETGDGWALIQRAGALSAMVVDGLGHGPAAAECAYAAEKAFYESPDCPPAELIERIHKALRATRGAAVSIFRADLDHRTLDFAGVGNVAGHLVNTEGVSRSFVSQAGIAGHDIRTVRVSTYPLAVNFLALLYSDGIGTRWSLNDYPGLIHRDTSLIAGVLYRDWVRGTDDSTILVMRERSV